MAAQSYSINIDSQFTQLDILSHSRVIFASPDAQLSEVRELTQWRHPRLRWQQQSDQSLWLHFQLHGRVKQSTSLAIVLGNPTLNLIDYYLIDQKGRIRDALQTGSERPFANRPVNHRKFVFPLELKPADKLDVYLQIRHEGNIHFPVQLWRSKSFFEHEQSYMATTGIMGGALALLACYFFITYILYTSPLRFWFATQTILFLALYLNLEGI